MTDGPPDQAAISELATPIPQQRALPTWLWAFPILWTVLIALALGRNLSYIRESTQSLARLAARSSIQMDVLYRRWAALHGGVYVPVTDQTPPNPYLTEVEERDITTPSGRRLTLMNPAYMTRQVHELGEALYRRHAHITSLNPIRPANAPDDWERRALQAFERGESEVSAIEPINGEPHLRLMRPLRADADCLKCHASQGYRAGDIRGGISVALPMSDYSASLHPFQRAEVIGHATAWGLGLVAFAAGSRQVRRRQRERKWEAEKLRLSEEKSHLAMDAVSDGLWDWDVRAGRVYYSPAWARILGETSVQPVYESWEHRIHPEDRQRVLSSLQHHLEGKTDAWQCEHRLSVRTGEWKWVLGRGQVIVRDPEGSPLRVAGTMQDISARKRAEEALRESSRLLEESQKLALLGGYVLEISTGRWQSSAMLDEIFGITDSAYPRSVEGWLGLIHSEDRQAMETYFQHHVIEGRNVFDRQYRIVRWSDQQERWVHGHGKLVLDPAGKPVRMAGVIQDITAQRLLEEQLRQAQKMEAIGQLAGGVAHDFNNILAATMMNLALMQEKPNLDPETQETLKDLETETKRAASLTRQLLMFSRRSVLEIQVLDLNEVVANLLKMLGRLLGEHITLVFDRNHTLPPVEADAGMLGQVLMNLAVNARDAMPQGGRITLATEAVEITPERAAANADRRPGWFACLSVSDTGCGMDAATVKRVFEPFFTTKDVGKGTGLGLATVHGIVAQHQGWVEVESELGRGATFRVFLPTTAKAIAATEESGPEVAPKGQETLLVVEDEPSLRKMLVRILRTLGYHVFEASNGQEAMTCWRDHGKKIDLLITDMVMPEGMTGLELAERVRVEKPDLKIIISSGYNPDMTHQAKMGAAGIVYLPKPYQVSSLGKTVRECLDRR